MVRHPTPPPTGLPVDTLNLRGGRLCLDFVNTVDPRWGDENRDYLDGYAGLVAWAMHAGALSPDELRALWREGERRPQEAEAIRRAAVELREALYRTFSTIAAGGEPSADDLATINAAVAGAMLHALIVPAGGGFAWGWDDNPRALDRPLWPVARSAAELLTAPELARVHECPGDRCGWLFLDQTKNRSRRWCSMSGCGSIEKARAYYRRRKAARAP